MHAHYVVLKMKILHSYKLNCYKTLHMVCFTIEYLIFSKTKPEAMTSTFVFDSSYAKYVQHLKFDVLYKFVCFFLFFWQSLFAKLLYWTSMTSSIEEFKFHKRKIRRKEETSHTEGHKIGNTGMELLGNVWLELTISHPSGCLLYCMLKTYMCLKTALVLPFSLHEKITCNHTLECRQKQGVLILFFKLQGFKEGKYICKYFFYT